VLRLLLPVNLPLDLSLHVGPTSPELPSEYESTKRRHHQHGFLGGKAGDGGDERADLIVGISVL
jgi:hypothetical protein